MIAVLLISFLLVGTQQISANSIPRDKSERFDSAYYETIKNSSSEEILILKLKGEDTVQFSENNQLFLQQNTKSNQTNFLVLDDAYAKKLAVKQTQIFDSLNQEVPMVLLQSYQYVYNGIAVKIRGYNVRFLLDNPQIDRIFFTNILNFPFRDLAVQTISADQSWNLIDNNKIKVTGKGMKVGILDSGIDLNHGDFSPLGMGLDKKVKFGRDFADNDNDPQDHGNPPHGTHVAGISSGNNPKNPLKRGTAPDSDLYVYKVFSNEGGGANPANIVAAADQSVKDKCHVINLSLGFGAPSESIQPDQPYYTSLNNAMKAGVVVCCAAGNDGSRHKNSPWPIHAPGVFDSVIQVGATDDRMTQPITITIPGQDDIKINSMHSRYSPPFKTEYSGLPVVDCSYGRKEDFQGIDVKGKIALISRGPKEAGIKFQEKNLNAKDAGAVGCIVYNYDAGPMGAQLVDLSKGEDPYSYGFIPNLTISGTLASQLKYKLSQPKATLNFKEESYITVADFTSAGPCFSGEANIFKPEISAPGTQINSAVLAVKNDQGVYEEQYKDENGTSMATPAVSGCVALLRQAHPMYNAFDVKSVLMNTSDVLKNPMNDEYFSYLYQGAGQINILNAIQSPLIIDPPALQRSTKQIDGAFDFTIRNTFNKKVSIAIKSEVFNLDGNPTPLQITVNATNLSLNPSEQKKFSVSFKEVEDKFVNRTYEGAIWVEISNNKELAISAQMLHIPFIIYKDSITKIDQSVTNFRISQPDINIENNGQMEISFDLNTGSLLSIKGITPEITMYENQARLFRIYAVDPMGNDWGNVYYAENLPMGHYKIHWDGKDLGGKEFLPNGPFSLSAEISGVELSVTNGALTDTKQKPEIFSGSKIQMSGSSIPEPPYLILSSVSKVAIDQEFTVDIILADAKDIQNVDIAVTFSKSITSIVGYSLGEFVDTSKFAEKKNLTFEKGLFSISASRDPKAVGNRLKIASFKLKATKSSTSKIGISLLFKDFSLKDRSSNIRKSYTNFPLVQIVKDTISFGDFNGDTQIDNFDYTLLIESLGKNYKSDGWDPKFDLNNDLIIDLSDVIVFSKFYSVNNE